METGTLISYSHSKDTAHKEKEVFRRKFSGYNDKSNNGKYKYKRGGLLNQIPHIKVRRSLIIINDKDKMKVIKVLKQFNIEYFTRKILLNKQDSKILG